MGGGVEEEEVKSRIWGKTPMQNCLNKPFMEVGGNRITRNAYIDGQTDTQTFSLLFWGEANKTTVKILAQSEKITDLSRYGII